MDRFDTSADRESLSRRVAEAAEKGRRLAEDAIERRASLVGPSISTRGLLVAEGDSWFDYPGVDVLSSLEDDHGWSVSSVAHRGDDLESMAYTPDQLNALLRKLVDAKRRNEVPTAILLSGGGNDIAGPEFKAMVEHASSPLSGLNEDIAEQIIDVRLRFGYVALLSAIDRCCEECFGRKVPIVVHGYDYVVPDGRGYLGGWGALPGPWLRPVLVSKGFADVEAGKSFLRDLINRFNTMLADLAQLPSFGHLHYIDLRGTLSTADDYRMWWDNEMHPSRSGFERVASAFAECLDSLDTPGAMPTP